MKKLIEVSIDFLKKYRPLIFWVLWGIITSIVFGKILKDFQTSITIFIVMGLFLGLTLQFVEKVNIRRLLVVLSIVYLLLMTWKLNLSLFQSSLDMKISKNFLIADIRQMASILEETHPDPYINGGGKIAFNRRMQNLIKSIPEDGMRKTEFYHHLCPFLAALGDGHTSLRQPFELDHQSPGGIPLYFQAVENILYVAGVIDSANKYLIGSKLISVENVPLEELLERQSGVKGFDNQYQLMRNLGYDGSLWHKKLLQHILPEWDGKQIGLVFLSPDGEKIQLSLKSNNQGLDHLVTATSSIKLPSIEKSIYVYEFMDNDKKNILFLIENMHSYRESFEMDISLGGGLRKGYAKWLYRKYNGKEPPANHKSIVAGLPSITELCRELTEEMKTNQSENLIIDLRRNQGGNAFLSTIFYYYLYGKDDLISFRNKRSTFVRKHSPLFWWQYPSWNIKDINKHQEIKLTTTDYDFSNFPENEETLSKEDAIRIIEEETKMSPTFWNEYQSEKYSGFYRPKNIYLLCSPMTNSSGYAFMHDHWSAGGKVVGVPSSQAGNNFGAWVGFKLKYSRLEGGVSHLYAVHFRNDPEMGKVFRPDYEMTYEILKQYDFDPNTEILFTLKQIIKN